MIEFLVCKECAKFIKSRFPEDVEWIEDGEQTDPGAAEYYVNLQILNAKDEKLLEFSKQLVLEYKVAINSPLFTLSPVFLLRIIPAV